MTDGPSPGQPPGKAAIDASGLPRELPGDPRRQAVPSIRGTVYQAWWSIDAWLRLNGPDEVIYLEGAEDFDVVRSGDAITVQVKHQADSLSLGTAKAQEALENFWKLSSLEPTRRVEMHYLTTSAIALEQDAAFDGLKGIDAWRAAQTNAELATRLNRYLSSKLEQASALRTFLTSSTVEEVQERLIRRFHWMTDQPDIEAVKRSVDDRIAVLLERGRKSTSLSHLVRKHLESRFWELILEPSSGNRRLTLAELLRQIEAATVVYLPIPIDQLSELIGNTRPGLGLLDLLLEKTPQPPDPLLERPAITQRLEELIRHRKMVLLTGTVHKGKTTIAQLVISSMFPNAWWINLTGRRADQVDNVLLALAGKIDRGDPPSLVVVDDLDISPTAHRVYRDSLGLVVHRMHSVGRGLLLTAQGASSDSAVIHDFKNVELLEVTELTADETTFQCKQHGCPDDLADVWGRLVTAGTRGHPKLVQVRLAELRAKGWPKPSALDLTTPSSAVTSARQLARQLLGSSVPGPIAELVYIASECSVPIDRSVGIRIAEAVPGIANAGDALDAVTGKWLERVDGQSLRATALLQGVASEIWSPEKRKRVHILIHGAILSKQTLDPSEAAALLLHAYLGGNPKTLAMTAMRLQLIDSHDAQREVERQLLWLPFVALEAGQRIADEPLAASILRSLQFRVATTLDADVLPQIAERWREDLERISNPQAKAVNRPMMWLMVGTSMSERIPISARLNAILGIQTLPDDLLEMKAEGAKRLFQSSGGKDIGLPDEGTTVQAMLLCATRSVHSAESLNDLVEWMDNKATDEIRQQFDVCLDWPLIQSLGAFIQAAWAGKHQETTDWAPWLPLLDRVRDYAVRHKSPRVGREAAKAKAIILAEYLDRSTDAISVLDQAETDFGSSPILLEQRSNVLYHAQKDENVLEIWAQLQAAVGATALDPFSHRRAGISAARLKLWDKAREIFLLGASSIKAGELTRVRFGLKVEAALAAALDSRQSEAAAILTAAVMEMPGEASAENDGQWEAVQRAAIGVCKFIQDSLWKPAETRPQLEPGYPSTPGLKVPKPEAGQPARSAISKAQVLHMATTVGVVPVDIEREIRPLLASELVYVRWFSAEAWLSHSYAMGASEDFIDRLFAFEKANSDLILKRSLAQPALEPDGGPSNDIQINPERWFGMLVAASVCAGADLVSRLSLWAKRSEELFGANAQLTKIVRLLLDGASQPIEVQRRTIQDGNAPPALRCGAAAMLLQQSPTVGTAIRLQSLLSSAFVSDASSTRQELFNRHVALRFADQWLTLSQNAFQFTSPRTSIPALLETISAVEKRNGTLRSMLKAAADATGYQLGEFMDRIL